MAEKSMKRKWIRRVIIIAAILGVVTTSVLLYRAANRDGSAVQYGTAAVRRGDIDVVVQAGGSIRPASADRVFAPASARIAEVSAANGDFVAKGDTLFRLESSSIDAEIEALEEDLSSKDAQLLAADRSKSSSVVSPVSGRIKAVYAEIGRETISAMRTDGGIILISADDRMEIRFRPDRELTPGDPVTVMVGEKSSKATISEISDGEAVVLLNDDSYAPGSNAYVYAMDGTDLGSGSLSVHLPFYVACSAGIVSEIAVSEGQEVSAGDTLLRLEEPVYSEVYLQLLASRQQAYDNLLEKREQKEGMTVVSPRDGVVENMAAAAGTTVQEGMLLCSVGGTDAFDLTVSVDELDIAGIKEGQSADIALDALSGASFSGTVSRISGEGIYANGVTTYEVTIRLDGTEGVLAGMSARADIFVASHEDVLLIPVSALKTIEGEKYVMVVPDPDNNTADAIETKVTVGLISGTQAEILTGLAEGQYVQDFSEESETDGMFRFGRNA